MEEIPIVIDKAKPLNDWPSLDSSSSSDPSVVSNKTIDMSSLELDNDQRSILQSAFAKDI